MFINPLVSSMPYCLADRSLKLSRFQMDTTSLISIHLDILIVLIVVIGCIYRAQYSIQNTVFLAEFDKNLPRIVKNITLIRLQNY